VQVDQINLSGIVERRTLFSKIRFNKRTHPNKHRNGCRLSTKWVLIAARRCAGKAVHILGN